MINNQSVFCYNSDIGRLIITTTPSCLSSIHFVAGGNDQIDTIETVNSDISNEIRDQLNNYFAGKLKQFNLPTQFVIGSKFDILVWDALCSIGYGERVSYKDIAILIGNPKGSRAVGGACNRNPISIVVPCHRVVGSNGSLTGYGGGLDIKRQLLEFEDNNLC